MARGGGARGGRGGSAHAWGQRLRRAHAHLVRGPRQQAPSARRGGAAITESGGPGFARHGLCREASVPGGALQAVEQRGFAALRAKDARCESIATTHEGVQSGMMIRPRSPRWGGGEGRQVGAMPPWAMHTITGVHPLRHLPVCHSWCRWSLIIASEFKKRLVFTCRPRLVRRRLHRRAQGPGLRLSHAGPAEVVQSDARLQPASLRHALRGMLAANAYMLNGYIFRCLRLVNII